MGLLQLIFGELPGTTPVVTEVQPEGMAEGMLVMCPSWSIPSRMTKTLITLQMQLFARFAMQTTLCEIETLCQER